MELHLLGGAGTVTGSKTLVTVDGAQVLVDCGLFQGFKALRERNWRKLPLDARGLDAVLLTHAHIDHSGFVPRLVADGYAGPIHCTDATADLCALLLPDSGHLQEEDARFANKRGYSKHQPAAPLYTEEQARHALASLVPVDWGTPITIGPLTATFRPAGHILGASMLHLRGPGGHVLFSGDLGRLHDPIMPAPDDVTDVPDLLVLESTYGNRSHGDADPIERLGEVVARTVARGGIVLIPSFAVGRAQAVLWGLHQLKQRGVIPLDLPVFLNSPMAVDATSLYQRHADLHRLSPEQVRALRQGVQFVRTVEESKRLNERTGPAVIVSASGMLTGGRVLHHLEAFGGDPANTLLFVGFQASGTRGAQILEGKRQVRIHGQQVDVRCEIERIDAWSAHADADEILTWLERWPSPPRHVLLNHGEPDASEALRARIDHELGWSVSVAELGASVRLDHLPDGSAGPRSPRVTTHAPELHPRPAVSHGPRPEPRVATPPAPPVDATTVDAAIQSLALDVGVVVIGGSRLVSDKEARRRLTRAELAAASQPDHEGVRDALRAAEGGVEHAHWLDEARRFAPLLATLAVGGACHPGLIVPEGHSLGEAVVKGAREVDLPVIQVDKHALRCPHLPAGARALVAFPGGFGTVATVYAALDRMLDGLGPVVPIVLVGRAFWHEVLDSERLRDEGLVEASDHLIDHVDSAVQAWAVLEPRLRPPLA